MQRRYLGLLLAGFVVLPAAQAQAPAGAPKKVAIVSLIGDTITIDTYRRRVGTGVDANQQEVIPVRTPAFDHTALLSAEEALTALLPGATVAPLSVPMAGSDADPARLLADGAPLASNPLVAGLRQQGYTQLLVIARHRALARMQLSGVTIGSGYVTGLGFYVDNDFPTINRETNAEGRGFVAPYVYIRLVLIDLASLQTQAQKAITASTSRSAGDNPDGHHPWGAMTAAEKVDALNRLIQDRIPLALEEMLRPR